MAMRPRDALVTLLLVLATAALLPAVAGSAGIQPNGRALRPAGRLTDLGNFPTGAALTPDGRFMWAVDAGHGFNDVRIMDVASGGVVQTLPLPGGYLGVAFAPDGRRAYVSGTKLGSAGAQGPVKGPEGDVVHVYDVDPTGGHATERDPITLPVSVTGSGQRNSLPPTDAGYPEGLAVTADGRFLVVAMNQADTAVIVDLRTGGTRSVAVGAYPARVAVHPRSATAYVSNEYTGTVSVLDVDAGKVTETISVGGPGGDRNAHPEGMVVDRRGEHLYVAVANRDVIADVDLRRDAAAAFFSVARPQAPGTQPTDVALSADGRTLYAADSGEDAIAAIALADRPADAGRAPANARRPRVVRRHRSVGSIQRYRLRHRQVQRRLKRALGRAAGSPAKRSAARGRARRDEAAIRRRWLVADGVTACGGPSVRQDRAWQRAVLRGLRRYGAVAQRRSRAQTRRFRALVAAARRRLPRVRRCTSAEAGELPGLRRGQLVGRIPTSAYPTAVLATPDGARLVWVSGKGLGTGPNADYKFFGTSPYGTYVLDKLIGKAGVLARPTDVRVRELTSDADAQVLPAAAQQAPEGTPVSGPGGGASTKIKHVFYIVRENRTYDQIFGSDRRGDGDPGLQLFDDNGVDGPTGGVTPNAHALARTFPLLDHVFANSEVSVDGHVITEGAYAIDYVQKGVAQNYSNRGRAYDFGIWPVTFPPRAFIFDEAVRRGVSFRSWGEVDAGNTPAGDDGRETYDEVVANTDFSYPNEALIGCTAGPPDLKAPGSPPQAAACAHDAGQLATTHGVTGGLSRVDAFNPKFQAMLAQGNVPALNYFVLPNDHTNGTQPGAYTPKALVADNDLGLGQLVELISQSPVWKDSAIFVVEDDSQDGADHVDAHRMPAFVISPYAKKGAVVSTQYDQYSVVRTIGLILGLQPLSLNDALATPMYDAFTNGAPDVEGTRYKAIQPTQPLDEVNPAGAADARLSAALPLDTIDVVPQAILDRILWHSVFGADATPPAPGPGASPRERARAAGAIRTYRRGGDVRAYLGDGDGDDD